MTKKGTLGIKGKRGRCSSTHRPPPPPPLCTCLVVCMFGNYNERLVWTTKLFSCICDITNFKSAYRNLNDWGGGRLVEHCTFQNRNPVRVFLYQCISDGNQLFSENFGCHFNFILHIMSDKAAFVSRAVLCTVLPGKPRALRLQQRLPLADNEFAYIYAATDSVSLWDYGINKFNCITVSVQFML